MPAPLMSKRAEVLEDLEVDENERAEVLEDLEVDENERAEVLEDPEVDESYLCETHEDLEVDESYLCETHEDLEVDESYLRRAPAMPRTDAGLRAATWRCLRALAGLRSPRHLVADIVANDAPDMSTMLDEVVHREQQCLHLLLGDA